MRKHKNKLARKRAAADRKWDKRAREIRRTPESFRKGKPGDLPEMEIPTR